MSCRGEAPGTQQPAAQMRAAGARGAGVRTAAGHRKTVAALTAITAASLGVSACQSEVAAEIVGKQWQITAVYDDPGLPHSIPEGIVAPTITLGQTTYTLADACGNQSGDLRWIGGAVEIEAPDLTRDMECTAQEQAYGQRFRKVMVGKFSYTQGANGLRLRELTEETTDNAADSSVMVAAGADQIRGWTAVTSAAKEN